MPNEPGLTLGRMVAAERNALAAVNGVKELRELYQPLLERLEKLELENAALKQQVAALNSRFYQSMGSGPTA